MKLLLKEYWFKIVMMVLVGGFAGMFYIVNSRLIDHELEMMSATKVEKVMIIAQADNFKFMNEAFGEDTAKMNYSKIMNNRMVSPEVKRIVRLAYAEYLKE